MLEDDGKSLFEKAVQFDYLTGKEGKGSMEELLNSKLQEKVANLEQDIDKMSMKEILDVRENMAQGQLGKGLFASNIDKSSLGDILQKISFNSFRSKDTQEEISNFRT